MKLTYLSKFLLNLYLIELDNFVSKMSVNLINSVALFHTNSTFLSDNKSIGVLLNYIPLKFIQNIKFFHNSKYYSISCFKNMKQTLDVDNFIFKAKFFYRKVFYQRFLNHFLIGIFGTALFAKLVTLKIKDFIGSNIRFNFGVFQFLDLKQIDIFHMGFGFKFVPFRINKLRILYLTRNNNYSSKVISRIKLRKLKISGLFKTRITSELISHLTKIMYLKKLEFNYFTERLLWTYIFQLESVRCIQNNKLLGIDEEKYIISDDVFSEFKDSIIGYNVYSKYSFDLYVQKLEVILRKVILDFSSLLSISINSFDLSINSLVSEVKNVLKFYNNKFYSDNFALNNMLSNSINRSPNQNTFDNFRSTVKIFAPFLFLIKKFRKLGFLHPLKYCPIGNSKYFIFEDYYIIQQFDFLLISLLTWYRCSDNFSKVKLFAEFFRESCLLTLARKHNKSKAWVYSVYTSDFILYRGFLSEKRFYSSKLSTLNLSKKFLFLYAYNFFDEQLFLTD